MPTAVRALHTAFELGAGLRSCPRTWPATSRPRGELAEGRGRRRDRRRGLARCSASCASAPSRPTRSCRSPPSARPGARSTTATGPRGAGALRRGDPGLRPRAVLRRLGDHARVGAAVRRRAAPSSSTTRRSGACRTTCRWWSPRSTRMRSTRHRGHRRQPQLHDHADGHGAQADPRRGRHRAGRDVDLPVGVGHRPAGGRGAARPGARPCSKPRSCRRPPSIRTRSRSTCCPRSRPSRTATTTRPRSAR